MTATELTGLELMKLTATTDDHRPRPPIATLIGVSVDEIDYGGVTMSIQTRPDFANPMGTVHDRCAVQRCRPSLATNTFHGTETGRPTRRRSPVEFGIVSSRYDGA